MVFPTFNDRLKSHRSGIGLEQPKSDGRANLDKKIKFLMGHTPYNLSLIEVVEFLKPRTMCP